jgi:glycosyltransferase involved in cell wall biosynthesis
MGQTQGVIRVAAFTGGLTVPSARFRVRQFVPLLAEMNIWIDEMGMQGGAYPPASRWRRPLWGGARLAALSVDILRSRTYDTILLQREMISSHFTLERFTKSPRVLDVDDAIHLLRGGGFARKLAQISDRVIAGNSYLAEWYSQWNNEVVILPTCVDTRCYIPATDRASEQIVVGWIGTSANFAYLESLVSVFGPLIAKHRQLHLRIVSDRAPALEGLDPTRWSFIRWQEAREIIDIQAMDIGIMPLLDTPWARGKCSFKMLQYMACGLPVVVSPVGMNREVLGKGNLGFGPSDDKQWAEALDSLISSDQLRRTMGIEGRMVVEQYYAADALAREFASHLQFRT